jgi:paraquat-inducible protein B
VELLQHAMEAAVGNGLRATLESGSLLTGQLYIDLNYYSDQPANAMGQFQGYQEIPTLSGGLGQIQLQITRLLKKLNGLPLDATVASANGALGELRGTLAEMRGLLADEATRSLPGTLEDTLSELNSLLAGLGGPTGFADNLNRSLIELNRTLNALRGLSDQLEDKPNSLIFPVTREDDPVPRAGQP